MEALIAKESAVLLLIDFQEKLMPSMQNPNELEDAAVRLVKGCRALDVPVMATAQYPKGLGGIIPSIKEAMGESVCVIEKTSFGCCGQEGFLDALEQQDRNIVLVAGIEAHVCVQQTVLELMEEGYEVYVLADCLSSRKSYDKEIALRRMSDDGAYIITYETALFEMLKNAKEPAFKAISAIVK